MLATRELGLSLGALRKMNRAAAAAAFIPQKNAARWLSRYSSFYCSGEEEDSTKPSGEGRITKNKNKREETDSKTLRS